MHAYLYCSNQTAIHQLLCLKVPQKFITLNIIEIKIEVFVKFCFNPLTLTTLHDGASTVGHVDEIYSIVLMISNVAVHSDLNDWVGGEKMRSKVVMMGFIEYWTSGMQYYICMLLYGNCS